MTTRTTRTTRRRTTRRTRRTRRTRTRARDEDEDENNEDEDEDERASREDEQRAAAAPLTTGSRAQSCVPGKCCSRRGTAPCKEPVTAEIISTPRSSPQRTPTQLYRACGARCGLGRKLRVGWGERQSSAEAHCGGRDGGAAGAAAAAGGGKVWRLAGG